LNFFEIYGFVVIREIISKEEVESSINDIWNILELNDESRRKSLDELRYFFKENFKPVKRDDPTTWYPENGWPQFDKMVKFLQLKESGNHWWETNLLKTSIQE
jgi:hypothetical protein